MLLCNAWRAFVNQQTPIATSALHKSERNSVSPKYPRTDSLPDDDGKTHLPDDPGVKSAIALIDIIDQCAEEGRGSCVS